MQAPLTTPTRSARGIAARAGRWSATHRRAAILGWLAFVVAAMALGFSSGAAKAPEDADLGVGDDRRGAQILDGAFPEQSQELVLVQARDRGDASALAPAVADVKRRMAAMPEVQGVESEHRVSDDGRSALVTFTLAGDEDQAQERVHATLATTADLQGDHPGLRIEQFGDASGDEALSKVYDDSFEQAEMLSLPVTLAILLVAFGSLMAAGVPVILALSAVLATVGILTGLSQIWPMEESVYSVVLLVGLAVGVDYSLFYLRREREERAAGRSEDAALLAAAATSGRAVLISGLTVMVAMAGMFFAGAATFTAIATGAILVVGVALIASLTVLPAVLSKLGDRVEKGRIPGLGRRRAGEPRAWSWILDRVLRRPLLSLALAGGALVALAIPATGLQTGFPGMDSISRDVPAMQTYDRMQAAFPGQQVPAVVAVRARDVTAEPVAAEIERLVAMARSERDLGPATVDVSRDRRVARVAVPVAGDGTDDRSKAALRTLRDDLIPATVGRLEGVEAPVTGLTAATVDFNGVMGDRIPIVFAFVLTLAFLLMLVTFRSIVIPLKAIVLNLLSVAAAYGVLALAFGSVTAWLPLFLFVILFGLSMDYHVFILTRVREAVDGGMRTEHAVAHAIKTTAGTVTSAAAIMVAVFAIFGTLPAAEFKQMGVGLAVAIALDATVVRAVLLPAAMKLLGEWNWYLPRSLRWLPQVAHEGAAEPARA